MTWNRELLCFRGGVLDVMGMVSLGPALEGLWRSRLSDPAFGESQARKVQCLRCSRKPLRRLEVEESRGACVVERGDGRRRLARGRNRVGNRVDGHFCKDDVDKRRSRQEIAVSGMIHVSWAGCSLERTLTSRKG